MSGNSFVRDAFDGVGRIASNLVAVGLVATAAGSLVWVRLREFYSVEDLAARGVAILVIIVGGRIVLVKALPAAAKLPGVARDALLAFWRRRQQEDEVGADWFSQFTNAYRPVRSSLALPIGVDEHGRFVEVAMKGPESHLLVTGITGTGKSVLANHLLIAAAMSGRYQVAIASLSGKDYSLVAEEMPNIHLQSYVEDAADPHEAMTQWGEILPAIFNSFNQEVVRRQRLLSQHNARQLEDLPDGVRPPETILVVEEFTNALMLVEETSRKARAELLGRVAAAVQFGRASGMHVILIGQRPTGNIPNNVKKQMIYVSLRVADPQEAYWSTNQKSSGAEKLRVVDVEQGIPGEALVVGALSGMRKVTIPLTDDVTLRLAAGAYAERTPFLGHPTWLYGFEEIARVTGVTSNGVTPPVTRHVGDPHSTKNVPPVLPVTTVTRVTRGEMVEDVMTPQLVRRVAEVLYDRNPAFADLGDAFTRERTILTFLCLSSGMGRTATSQVVFGGRNGRYQKFLDLCETFWALAQKGYRNRNSKEN